MKVGKEFILLFSVLFLPGLLSQSGAVDPSGWNSIYYHLVLLAVAIPQTFLVVSLANLNSPGISRRLGWQKPVMSDLVTLAIAMVLLVGSLWLISALAILFPGRGALWEPAVDWSFSRAGLLPLVFVSSLAIGYREEIFYRAYLVVRGEDLGLHPAAIVAGSSLLFAIGHLYQGWVGFITALLIGATLGFTFVWRRSLHGIAVAHGLYNALVLLMSGR